MSDMSTEKLDQYLEPLVLSLLSCGQNHLVEKYIDLLGIVKEDECYKHILFFWNYATELDVEKFNMCYPHLEALRVLNAVDVYDLKRCERFYEWRKNSI